MKNHPNKTLSWRCQSAQRYLASFVWLFAIVLGLQSANAQLSLPLYERFAYTNNEPLGANASSATNWGWGNSASGSSAHPNTNASLFYSGLPIDTTPIPNGITPGGLLANTGTGKVRGANFLNPVTNVTIYSSFLLNVRSLAVSSSDRLMFSLGSAITGSTADGSAAVWLDPSGRLKISKNSTAAAAASTTYQLVISNTYLVVFRYQVNTGSPDQVDLWLNPGPLGVNNNIPTPDLTTTNNANARTFNSMTFNGNAPTHVFYMDEIRVGTNWSDVTPPSTSWAGGTYNVTGGGSGCGSDSFSIGLSGSDSGVDYLLYTNGLPAGVDILGSGSSITFGAQSTTATYTVLATNTADGTLRWMRGNGVVSVLVPPSVTVQPAPVLAATNSSVVYIVSANGTGLNYQWYRNGAGLSNGGHYSGVTTPTLSVSPATAADVATATTGYYCIITNACGNSATTITNALTLHAPGNIVWQGAPTNIWDIATSANWTNSAGAFVVFNPGDNVILDDSYQNPIIALQSPYLSPGLVSFVGANFALAINGSGNINNNGSIFGLNSSLLINGAGKLTVSNANDFSGGTTISNGMLAVATFTHPLGYGPITLAGGNLKMQVAAASGTVLSNNIVVADNSTWQYDGTGGNAVNYSGSLSGLAGKTLTISNDSIADTLNWLRLLNGFTNNANIILASPGAAIELNTVLTGGNQVLNGTISGGFGKIRVSGGAGTLIINGQNTFNDLSCYGTVTGNGATGYGLYMSGGNANVGFGVDSVSSSPPTIDSSPVGTGKIAINVGSDGGSCGFFSSGGAHTIGNPVIFTSATNNVTVAFNGNNNLTFSGEINLSGVDGSGGTNRLFAVTNTALTTFSGLVDDGGLVCGIIKTGAGTLDLNGSCTYGGPTVVSNGILAGIGTIASPVTIATNGSIGAGTASVGKLNLNSDLTINGNGFFKLNKSVNPSNDVVSVSGTLANTGTGTITVTNIGVPTVVIGDRFKLFNKAVANGSTLTVVGAGMTWSNGLAVDGSIQALSAAMASYPTNINVSFTGSTLSLSWPSTHLGWLLQSQTNSLNVGIVVQSNAWFDISNSANLISTNIVVNPANPTVFYRLRHP